MTYHNKISTAASLLRWVKVYNFFLAPDDLDARALLKVCLEKNQDALLIIIASSAREPPNGGFSDPWDTRKRNEASE
jgi:hypothetical protein